VFSEVLPTVEAGTEGFTSLLGLDDGTGVHQRRDPLVDADAVALLASEFG
jgi:hypothetical protein